MTSAENRPAVVAVIGYGALAIGLLLLSSGVGAIAGGDPVFRVYGAVAGAIALLIIAAAWAVLRMRAWGALVLEVLGGLFLMGITGFLGIVTWANLQLSHGNSVRTVAVPISLLVFYGLPVLLAMRSLRKVRLKMQLQ